MNRKIIWAFLSVFSLFACTEADDLTLRDDGGVVVSFTAPGVVAGEVGITRADVKLAEDTTVRILVYRRIAANANMETDTYVGENTYKVKANGDLEACVVDKNGKITTGTAKELRLIQGEYDFYAITPALPVAKESANNNARKVSVKHGVDYATSLTEKGEVTTTSGAIALTTLDRKCSLLQFAVDRKSANVTSIVIDEVTLDSMTNEPLEVFMATDMGVKATTNRNQSLTLPGSLFTITDSYKGSGSQIVLPKWGGTIKLGMKLKYNGSTSALTLAPAVIKGLAFSQGTRYIFNVKLLGGTIKLELTVTGWEGDINVDAGNIGENNSLTITVGTWTDVNLDGSSGNVTGTTGTWEGDVNWDVELGKNPGLTLPGTPTWIDGNVDGSTGNTTGNSDGTGWGDKNTDGSSGNITGNGNGTSWGDVPSNPDFPGGVTTPITRNSRK